MSKKTIVTLILAGVASLSTYAQKEMVTVHGVVTDFNNNPIDSVKVSLKSKSFKDLYTTTTGKDGKYTLKVPKGRYYCLYAINLAHYGKTKLEYWAWNVPAFEDMEINPQYERMELYGLNVFEPQVGPFETYMVYFRPMSLTKANKGYKGTKSEVEQKAAAKKDTIDIAPSTISPNELKAFINDREVKVIQVQRVVEYGRGGYIFSYIAQIQKNKNEEKLSKTDKITLILHSKETNEYGRAECYYEKPEYPN
jgi:hypothetical protein